MTVGLGSDGTYVNCSIDMVEQMKFAALIQNVTHLDPTLMSTERVIEMATIEARGRWDSTTRSARWRSASARTSRCFDLDKAHATVGHRPTAALVFSAHGTDVDTVLVNGKVVLRGGELQGFDREQEVLAEARRRAVDVVERAGITSRVSEAWRRVS